MTTGAISAVRGQTRQLPIKPASQQTGAIAFAGGSGKPQSARDGASNSNGLVTCGLVIAAALAAAAYFIFGGSKKSEGGDGDTATS